MCKITATLIAALGALTLTGPALAAPSGAQSDPRYAFAGEPAPIESAASLPEQTTIAYEYCRTVTWKHSKGIWPYYRAIFQQTRWCWNHRIVTYRSSTSWTDVNGVCRTSGGPWTWKTAGGVGYSYVDVRTEAEFACRTPWWFHLNDHLWMVLRYTAWGDTYVVAHN